MIIRHTYLDRIKPFIDKPLIKVLTGVRRSGKSVLLQQIQNLLLEKGVPASHFYVINFESSEALHIQNGTDLIQDIRQKHGQPKDKLYIFLDEIQDLSGWEKAVNALRVDFDCDIYITGSNSTLLSGELATHIAGRYVSFDVYPLSFMEFLELLRKTDPVISDQKAFEKYIKLGGMPFLHHINFEEEPSKQYLEDLYASVLIKDVVSRNNIRDADLLQRLVLFLISNIGNPFSARSISAYLKNEYRNIAPETVINYIKACVDACLFYPAKRQDLVGKKVLQIDEKYYLVDHGIRQAVYGENERDIHLVLENIVYMELIRRGYKVSVGRIGDKEIDFVAQDGYQRLYVQVSYLMADEATFEREIRPLLLVQDNYPKLIISMDPINRSTQGIQHFPIVEFLLKSGTL